MANRCTPLWADGCEKKHYIAPHSRRPWSRIFMDISCGNVIKWRQISVSNLKFNIVKKVHQVEDVVKFSPNNFLGENCVATFAFVVRTGARTRKMSKFKAVRFPRNKRNCISLYFFCKFYLLGRTAAIVAFCFGCFVKLCIRRWFSLISLIVDSSGSITHFTKLWNWTFRVSLDASLNFVWWFDLI